MLATLKKARTERGFTLIEIAIVVALIGLLLTISLPLFSGARNRAYIAEGRMILSEWKAMMWTCWVEKNFNDAACNTFSQIGWSNRPTSDVWNTTGATMTHDTDCSNVGNTDIVKLVLAGDGDPLSSGVQICLQLNRSTGRVTETISGL